MKLFFKRAPEVHAMLGRLLSVAVNDSSNQDIHDRALLYYRILSTDLTVAGKLFKSQNELGLHELSELGFAESKDYEQNNKVFVEFNTLAVIYGISSNRFIADEYQLKLENLPVVESFKVVTPSYGQTVDSSPTVSVVVKDTNVTSTSNGSVNLLDWDDDIPVVATVHTTNSSTIIDMLGNT